MLVGGGCAEEVQDWAGRVLVECDGFGLWCCGKQGVVGKSDKKKRKKGGPNRNPPYRLDILLFYYPRHQRRPSAARC